MTLFFWQNSISPHQFPYIRGISELSDQVNVVLVAQNNISKNRKDLGWVETKIESTGSFKIIKKPNAIQINHLIKENDKALHIFSGIRFNAMVFKAFKTSLEYDIKRYLIVEGPTYYRRPKFLNKAKTWLLEKRYFSYIDKVFAIGMDAYDWYLNWGFSKKQIIKFSYCVDKSSLTTNSKSYQNEKLKILYVGSFIKLKGLEQFFNSVFMLNEKVNIDLIGNGKELESLKRIVLNRNVNHEITFYNSKSNSEVRSLMNEYDCLVLPSLYDGWGAVVNEALMAGLFVICSDHCGAKELIHHKKNGLVFSHKKKKDLLNSLYFCIENVKLIRSKKDEIRNWSQCIEPETIAKYFLNALKSDEEVKPPWKKELN